jgi:hypothetical protein
LAAILLFAEVRGPPDNFSGRIDFDWNFRAVAGFGVQFSLGFCAVVGEVLIEQNRVITETERYNARIKA